MMEAAVVLVITMVKRRMTRTRTEAETSSDGDEVELVTLVMVSSVGLDGTLQQTRPCQFQRKKVVVVVGVPEEQKK